ncbi:MAG: STAS domain-containing protein [Sedimentisphaerales bacterium]|jgi:anti-anti-sigma factor
MGFQNWSDDIILVDLTREPRMRGELKTLIEIVRDRGDCDVVVDFSNIDIMTSTSISGLLRLRKLLTDCGHRLIFCNVLVATRSVFSVVGLDEVFEFADDKFASLATLQSASEGKQKV